jgi:hypothetical protein
MDMRKAYDLLEWDYLEAIMIKLGFARQFVETVMRGVRTVSFSVYSMVLRHWNLNRVVVFTKEIQFLLTYSF